MQTIKAIPTFYKGYHFRSRLEARWAVFFDSLGIKWEYEKNSYGLATGWYLPDFFLPHPWVRFPEAGYWIEIKGVEPSNIEKALADELCFATKHNVYIMHGLPGENLVYHVHHSMNRGEYLKIGVPGKEPSDQWFGLGCLLTRFCSSEWDFAIESARSARFEHGESGSTFRG